MQIFGLALNIVAIYQGNNRRGFSPDTKLWTGQNFKGMESANVVNILGLMPQRFLRKVFPNQEDLFFKNIEVQFNDPHVERVRRAHRNDMENILPYFTMALAYICTNPNPTLACNLFRVAAVARILHTLVYAFYPVPQPSRVIAFATMFVITMYMACAVGLQTLKYI
ncbi:microsomal glutathione S-transferase 1 isoform X3 [Haematobia irritans]|uniref:microsomal glutathione S-transferase 1 isoform X3 n=1 Tax=Haematobia irritans TaxID=7368 RepID=UPI003F4FB824